MSKIKKISAAVVLTLGLAFMFNTETSNAVEPNPDVWVCCKASAEGCEDILGNPFPTDERRTTPTCDPVQN